MVVAEMTGVQPRMTCRQPFMVHRIVATATMVHGPSSHWQVVFGYILLSASHARLALYRHLGDIATGRSVLTRHEDANSVNKPDKS
ncbi:hypothetical protein E3N88_24483 [Mikania micrantha]|uniref:Uncharacterized protein n=1 Tax=Mikania micrantha TaxID=192012 RepID=A0A5N6N203_9ASTR|nr:hypothetical protein E3N88_24483 [Mikania micrantha]